MVLRLIFILALMMVATLSSAQRIKNKPQELNPVVKAYIDSLVSAKARLDSVSTGNKDDVNEKYFRLFSPLTFYYGTAMNQLSIFGDNNSTDKLDAAIDEALMTTYLNRPDLVVFTEHELKKA